MIQKPSQIFIAGPHGVHRVERPQKRKRCEDDEGGDGGDGPAEFAERPRVNLVLDNEWYKEQDPSADCFVQVQNVLFKIHEQVFAICEGMTFDLVQHRLLKGPLTRDSPLFIPWLTADQYRALLWMIYLPANLTDNPADIQEDCYVPYLLIPKLRDYCKKHLRDAAFNEKYLFVMCSSSTLAGLLTHFKTGDMAARDNIVKIWIKRLREEKHSFVNAIIAASHVGVDCLLGVACFLYLREIHGQMINSADPCSAMHLIIDSKLGAQHIPCLLQGYFSLTNLSHRLRHNPIALPMGDRCSSGRHEKCVAVWKERWGVVSRYARITSLPPPEVVFLVRDMRESISNDDDLRDGLTFDCRLAGLKAMQKLMEDVGDPDALGTHFVIQK
ncbi:hypothetical protein BJ165DRAFT_1593762 [Panaeolus papilionaceus]|nr:hypothetical protein BJ165DRAFT_1593762 [Panaeolus papilionaceus]